MKIDDEVGSGVLVKRHTPFSRIGALASLGRIDAASRAVAPPLIGNEGRSTLSGEAKILPVASPTL